MGETRGGEDRHGPGLEPSEEEGSTKPTQRREVGGRGEYDLDPPPRWYELLPCAVWAVIALVSVLVVSTAIRGRAG